MLTNGINSDLVDRSQPPSAQELAHLFRTDPTVVRKLNILHLAAALDDALATINNLQDIQHTVPAAVHVA